MFPFWDWLGELSVSSTKTSGSNKRVMFVFYLFYFLLPFVVSTSIFALESANTSQLFSLVEIRPLIEVTKASGSYSHSNKDISFPCAGFINYAFLLQDLYFRVGIRMRAQFLPQWKGFWPPATFPAAAQIAYRAALCRLENINTALSMHTHQQDAHVYCTRLMVLCTCLSLWVCSVFFVFFYRHTPSPCC